MSSTLRAAAVVVALLLLAAAVFIGQDWRLVQRYLSTPGDPAEPGQRDVVRAQAGYR